MALQRDFLRAGGWAQAGRDTMRSYFGGCFSCIVVASVLVACLSGPSHQILMSDLGDFQSATVPLHFDKPWDKHPGITMVLQRTLYRLLLDTGFYGALGLKPEVMDKMGLPTTGRITYRDSEGKLYEAREAIVPSARIGEMEFIDLPAQEDLFGPAQFDGQIGLGLLKSFDVLVNYRDASMTLFRNDHQLPGVDSQDWFRVPLTDDLKIRINMDHSGGEYLVGIDTGSNSFAMPKTSDLANSIIDRHGFEDGNRIINQRNQQEVYRYIVDDLYVDGHALGAMEVIMADMAAYMGNGLLGYDFFSNHAVYFDFDGAGIYLKEYSAAAQADHGQRVR